MARWKLSEIVARLVREHGEPAPPPSHDPWRLVLWENVAYLANDERRRAAYELLIEKVGATPRELLRASDKALLAVAKHGILPETFAEKLRTCARIATELGAPDGDLTAATSGTRSAAMRALRRFPGIGAPGAEKILLFARRHASLALESNGLRVLARLGFADDGQSYAKTYKQVQESLASEVGGDCDALIRAHQALRRHGQNVCKNSKPRCDECVLRARCAFAEAAR